MTDFEKQVFLGTLLGDAFIQIGKSGNKNVVFEHSIAQEEYALWKASLIKSIKFNTRRRQRNTLFKKENRNIVSSTIEVYFSNNVEFNDIYSLIYKPKKTITQELLSLLSPISLALWYLDDGSYHLTRNYIEIATESFSLEEHKLVRKWFLENYDIAPEIVKRGKGKKKRYRLYFPREEAKKFLKVIVPVIPENVLKHKHPAGWQSANALNFGFHARIDNNLATEEKEKRILINLKNFYELQNDKTGFQFIKYQYSELSFSYKLIQIYFGSIDIALKKAGIPTKII